MSYPPKEESLQDMVVKHGTPDGSLPCPLCTKQRKYWNFDVHRVFETHECLKDMQQRSAFDTTTGKLYD